MRPFGLFVWLLVVCLAWDVVGVRSLAFGLAWDFFVFRVDTEVTRHCLGEVVLSDVELSNDLSCSMTSNIVVVFCRLREPRNTSKLYPSSISRMVTLQIRCCTPSQILATIHVLNLFVKTDSHLLLLLAAPSISAMLVASTHERLHVVLCRRDWIVCCSACVNALAVHWYLLLVASEVVGQASALVGLCRLGLGLAA